MVPKHVDFAIIGGGVAGSLLAHNLVQRGLKVVLFDDQTRSGSSQIAAGLINPITGRHFVKSWKIEELLVSSSRLYGQIEASYNVRIQHDFNVIRMLKNPGMTNEWAARELDLEYQQFIVQGEYDINPGVQKESSVYGVISNAKRVDFKKIRLLVQQVLARESRFLDQKFDFHKAIHHENSMEYDGLHFDRIIFCEGSYARNNPLWSFLPFVPAKGERLVIHAPELQLQDVYNDGKIIIPLEEDHYWVGSNYEWDQLDTQPTQKMYDTLKAFLDKTLSVPYTILDHSAHIRPSTYNRRPFVGEHPEYKNCYILNGLGAKGASLAPYCIEQLLGHIFEGEELDAEIDVSRVEKSIS